VLPSVEFEVALPGVEVSSVARESGPVRLPALDGGERLGPVVEAEVPPPVVHTLQPVEGGVHRHLPEHAQRAASVHLGSGHDSDPAPLGEADVLVGELVAVPDDGPRARHHGVAARPPLGLGGRAAAGAQLHHELSFEVASRQTRGLHQHLVSMNRQEAGVLALTAEEITFGLRALHVTYHS